MSLVTGLVSAVNKRLEKNKELKNQLSRLSEFMLKRPLPMRLDFLIDHALYQLNICDEVIVIAYQLIKEVIEDLNDHNQLRKDILLKLLSKKDNDLASASTLCRLEQMSTPTIKDQDILVTAFINSYEEPPKSICLDFDPTDVVLYEDQDVVLYGDQEFKKYHRYYRDYCYLPLIVSYLW